ncbi:MAG: toll/interleukin-1 receptor domain-containing protein [Sulfurifustis sp.]
MARCTAPVYGHRSSSAAANCPACGGRSRYYGGGYSSGYSNYGYSPPSYSSGSSGGGRSGGGSGGSARPRWSRAGSSVSYTLAQVQSLTPIRQTVETRAAAQPDLRDVFLCHAWDDRQGSAKELHDLLVAAGVKVWFSEKDLGLGVPMMRAIDKGLANSRIGLVLVTPALLARLPKESVADKELSALLARNQLVPIVHNTTYEALRNVSPLLASRSGLDTAEDSMAVIAKKIAELVAFPVSD